MKWCDCHCHFSQVRRPFLDPKNLLSILITLIMSPIYRTRSNMRYFTPNLVILDVTLKMPVTPVILLYNLYSLGPFFWGWQHWIWWISSGGSPLAQPQLQWSMVSHPNFFFFYLYFFFCVGYDNDCVNHTPTRQPSLKPLETQHVSSLFLLLL